MFILLFSISIDSILAENGIHNPEFEWNRAWSRFPSPEDMPFILPFFIDLYRKTTLCAKIHPVKGKYH